MDRLHGRLIFLALLAPLAGMLACRPADAAADVSVPRAAELTQFRAGLAEPQGLSGGAPSRDALIAAFAGALERRDTAALADLVLSRAEFAWLYYPTNPQARPPYDLAPDLMWFLLRNTSEKGARRLLGERAGVPLNVVGHRCDPATSREGRNTVTGPCIVRRLTARGDTIEERLFGLILERGGRHKFVSYANKL